MRITKIAVEFVLFDPLASCFLMPHLAQSFRFKYGTVQQIPPSNLWEFHFRSFPPSSLLLTSAYALLHW